jgi:hypothetical protein
LACARRVHRHDLHGSQIQPADLEQAKISQDVTVRNFAFTRRPVGPNSNHALLRYPIARRNDFPAAYDDSGARVEKLLADEDIDRNNLLLDLLNDCID